MTEIHLGDTGTRLIADITEDGDPLPLQDATVLKYLFEKKNRSTIERIPTFVTDGTDGKLVYVTLASDIDLKGIWKWQVYLEIPGWKGHTDQQTFTVGENIVVTP